MGANITDLFFLISNADGHTHRLGQGWSRSQTVPQTLLDQSTRRFSQCGDRQQNLLNVCANDNLYHAARGN